VTETKPVVHTTEKIYVAGLPFDMVDKAETVRRLCEAMRDRRRLFLSTPNLNFLVAAQTDEAFKASVLQSDMSVADGMPILWLARKQGTPLPERVAGSDLFEALRRGAGRSVLGRPVRVVLFWWLTGCCRRSLPIVE